MHEGELSAKDMGLTQEEMQVPQADPAADKAREAGARAFERNENRKTIQTFSKMYDRIFPDHAQPEFKGPSLLTFLEQNVKLRNEKGHALGWDDFNQAEEEIRQKYNRTN